MKRFFKVIFLIIWIAAIVHIATQSAASQGDWRSVAPIFWPRDWHAAATGFDGRIYVAGGGSFPLGGPILAALDTAEVYDPTTKTWTTLPSMSAPRAGVSLAAGETGHIYAIGGMDAFYNDLATAEAFNPNTSQWYSVAPMSIARRLHRAVTGKDGRIYVMGGYSNIFGWLNTFEVYDPTTNTWTTLAPMLTAREGMVAAVGPDGRIFAMGGLANGVFFGIVEVYDPTTNTWTTLPPMPTVRYGAAGATGPDGRFYVMGGTNANGFLSSVEAYDPRTGIWTSLPPMSITRYALAGAASNGQIYAISGATGSNWDTNTVETYVLATYNICVLYDQTKAVKRGATIPIKIQLCDNSGKNMSDPSIIVAAISVTRISESVEGVVQDSGNANPDYDFRYDSTLGDTGGYIFNFSTRGLISGTYKLCFTATPDLTPYSVQFQVK